MTEKISAREQSVLLLTAALLGASAVSGCANFNNTNKDDVQCNDSSRILFKKGDNDIGLNLREGPARSARLIISRTSQGLQYAMENTDSPISLDVLPGGDEGTAKPDATVTFSNGTSFNIDMADVTFRDDVDLSVNITGTCKAS